MVKLLISVITILIVYLWWQIWKLVSLTWQGVKLQTKLIEEYRQGFALQEEVITGLKDQLVAAQRLLSAKDETIAQLRETRQSRFPRTHSSP